MIPSDNAKKPQAYAVQVDSLMRVGTGAEPSTHTEPSTQTYQPVMSIPTNGKGPSFQLPVISDAPPPTDASIASPLSASPLKKKNIYKYPPKPPPSKASVATKKQSSKATVKVPPPRATEKTSSSFTEAARLSAKAAKKKSALAAASSHSHKQQGSEQKLTAKGTLPPNHYLNKVDSKGKSNDVTKSRAAAISDVTVPPTGGKNSSNIIPLDSKNRRKCGPSYSEIISSQQQPAWLLPGPSLQITMTYPLPPYTKALLQQQNKTAPPPTINPSSPPPMNPPLVGPKLPSLHPPKQQPSQPPPPKQSKQPPVLRPSSSSTSKRKRNSSLATTRFSPFYVHQEELVQITPNQIQQAIPENASSVFHLLDRRVNLDASSSKDANMYSLLRSWVQDDPYRQIPPPGADISEQYNSSITIPTQPTTAPSYEEPIMEEKQCLKETKTTAAQTTIPIDMLTALRFQRQLPPTDYVRKEFLARARESRKAQRKTYASRAAAVKASLKRKGIVLPCK
jgi:hypothetical protein